MCDGKDGTCDRTAHTGCLNKEFPPKGTGSARNAGPRRRSRPAPPFKKPTKKRKSAAKKAADLARLGPEPRVRFNDSVTVIQWKAAPRGRRLGSEASPCWKDDATRRAIAASLAQYNDDDGSEYSDDEEPEDDDDGGEWSPDVPAPVVKKKPVVKKSPPPPPPAVLEPLRAPRHNASRWARASKRAGRASGGRPSSTRSARTPMRSSGSRNPRCLIGSIWRTCGRLERRRTSWPRRRPCRRPGLMQQPRSLLRVLRRRRAVRYSSRRRSRPLPRAWSRGRRHLLYKRRPRRLLFLPRWAAGLLLLLLRRRGRRVLNRRRCSRWPSHRRLPCRRSGRPGPRRLLLTSRTGRRGDHFRRRWR